MTKKILLLALFIIALTLTACSSSNVNGSIPVDPNALAVDNYVESVEP